MTAALWFTFGVLAGASSLLVGLLVVPARRTLPASEPVVVAPVPFVTGCRCLPCATAVDVHAVRMLPEATR